MRNVNPDLAVFAGDPLNPVKIWDNLEQMKVSGWTTVILSLFHVDSLDRASDIYFNNYLAISGGTVMDLFLDWQNPLSQLLEGSTVRQIYASIGGGDPVRDFTHIAAAYYANNGSFHNTTLEFNLKALKSQFPAITGIDMDIEESYDETAFLAFCKLVRGLGYDISFCPFGSREGHGQGGFWFFIRMLEAIEKSDWGKGAVKRFNVQYYADQSSPPLDYVEAIKERLPDFDTSGFINIGCWARYKNKDKWEQSCPSGLQELLVYFRKLGAEPIGGAFIWNLDYILETTLDPGGCDGYASMGDYTRAIWNGMSAPVG